MNLELNFKSPLVGVLATLAFSTFAGSFSQDSMGQTIQNQTASSAANMTGADFSAVRDSLINARQGIFNNDSSLAYGAINRATSDLFALTQSAGSDNETLTKQLSVELRPIHRSIDLIRDALRDNNSTQALRTLNSADVRLFNVISELPPGEDAEAETTQ
jgi:hypothetical protein